jgi:ABC-2 type transport system ATP-binding protein
MPDEIVIRAENVSKDFVLPHEKVNSIKGLFTSAAKRGGKRGKETQHALKDVSFEIKQGEFFGIVGRNGSGKSTMLKILANIYQPTSGKVYTHGKLVPFIELGVGFNPELTGRENVYLNGALLGFGKREIDSMYNDVVEFAELERFMDQKLKNYSSGMQVRLAFSVAVRAQADILLIDEVLAVGDADFQRKCFNYFSQLRKEKTTVVFVSHDMGAVREYCDRAMLIEKSEVVEIGSTDEVSEKYLRLFTKESAEELPDKNKPQNRWGDYVLKTFDVAVTVSKSAITIRHKFEVNANIERPITGFRIRDASGREITGTNTKVENKRLPDLVKGQKVVVTWRLPNILSDGKYSVDSALHYADEITVADWWNDAAYFAIKKGRHLPYAIDPEFDLKVELENS